MTSPVLPPAAVRLLTRWPVLLAGAAAGAALLTGWTFVRPRTWAASATFQPQAPTPTSLRGLAAQFGFEGGSDPGQSPEFYQELLRTDELLGRVVLDTFDLPHGARGTLVDYYRVARGDADIRQGRAVEKLRRGLVITASRRTGLVSLTVRTTDPSLSRQVVQRFLAEVARFNQETRQSRAAAERRFIEERLDTLRAELRSAEDRAQAFLVRNRDISGAPELRFEYDRLQREVVQRQAVVTTLTQNFEQARIDEVRDTPVYTVVQPPRAAITPVGSRAWAAGGGALLGGGVAIAWVLGGPWWGATWTVLRRRAP